MGDSTGAARVYGGLSADERVAERRARLLEAGLDLVGTEGAAATTVTAVCDRARVSPRYFYESFENLDQLLVAVFDDIVAEVSTEVGRRLPVKDAAVAEVLRASITAWVDVVGQDERKGRVAFVEALGSEPLMQRRLASTRMLADSLAQHARQVQPEPAPAASDAFEMAGLVAAGALIETMIEWLHGRLRSAPDDLVEGYTTLCSAAFDAAADARELRDIS